MTLSQTQIRRLAGRLVLGRVPALTLDDAHRQALSQGTIGGITLFKENVADLKQLARLTGEIIEASFHNCLLAVDQEGGAVQRFDEVISPLPSPMALAALDGQGGQEEAVETITAISAGQLKKLGINMLLAPTLDLQTNARNPIICTRAYSDDADTTASIGKRVARAIEKEGLVAVGKHFPGHGSTSEDSHFELACVDKSEAALMASDLVPFARLAKQLKAILIGHIWLPQLVKDKCPATLSQTIIEGLLREKLGFEGLVVSDDMIMKAITEGYGLGQACVQALIAGVDLLLVCGTMEQTMEAVEAIVSATEQGRVSEERLRQAAGRIEALFPAKPTYIDANDTKAISQFEQEIQTQTSISRQCSASAIAVLQSGANCQSLKNLRAEKTISVVAPQHARYPMQLAGDLCLALGDDIQILDIRYPIDPTWEDIQSVGEEVAGLVIFITYRSAINTGQTDLGEALLDNAQKGLIHVASDSPYDLDYMTGCDRITSLATFDPSCQAMSALADVLTGVRAASGKCPLKIVTMA